MDEQEKRDIERRIRAGFTTRMFDLASAGGSSADGLAKRIADAEKSLVITWTGDVPVISWGYGRANFTQNGLDVIARGAFREAPEFATEAAALQDRLSKQIGFNSKTVTQLFPASAVPSLTPEQARARDIALKRSTIAGSI